MCTFGYQYGYLHYNVGIQVVVEFPIYFHSCIPDYQYAVLFHDHGNMCAPLVINMCIYITMLGSRLWLNSQFISILGFQATNMLSCFTILGTCVHLWLPIWVSTLQRWDQVMVEFPIYFHSWIPGYQYAFLFHNLGICVHLWLPIYVSTLQCWDPGCG